MPQDAFTLRHIARELDGVLAGGRINKIIQPSRDEVSLIIYTKRRNLKLVLNTNAQDCGAYFEDSEEAAPLVAPNFCMLLRKHLLGATFKHVSLLGFERILVFTLDATTDFSTAEKTLYLEVMGKYSNLILAEGGVILGALKQTTVDNNARRMIFPNLPYLPPAPQDKVNPSDFAALREVLEKADGDLANFLFTRVAGLAPSTAQMLAENYGGGDLAEYVHGAVFSDMVCPCVVEEDGRLLDFCARSTGGGRKFSTLLEAETYYYTTKRARKRLEDARRRLQHAVSAAVKKHEKRLAQTLEKKRACENVEELRVKGELLTANLYAVSRGMQGIELDNWYDGTRVKVALNPRLTPAENAQSYFRRYRKAKRTLEMLAPYEEETRRELDYLAALSTAIGCAETEEDFASLEEEIAAAGLLRVRETRKKRDLPSPRVYEYGGFTLFAGRNNLQNDRLVRAASPDDLWLHTRVHHSTHVIIRTEGRSVPEDVKLFAAGICAKFSDANGDSAPVDCTRVKYVKKPRGAKAGFVTYTEATTLLGVPPRD